MNKMINQHIKVHFGRFARISRILKVNRNFRMSKMTPVIISKVDYITVYEEFEIVFESRQILPANHHNWRHNHHTRCQNQIHFHLFSLCYLLFIYTHFYYVYLFIIFIFIFNYFFFFHRKPFWLCLIFFFFFAAAGHHFPWIPTFPSPAHQSVPCFAFLISPSLLPHHHSQASSCIQSPKSSSSSALPWP